MPNNPEIHADEVRDASEQSLLLPGGKIDPDAIRRIAEESGDDDDAELRRVTLTLKRDLGSRLDKYLTSRITFLSRNQLQRLIESGGVLVNDRVAKSSTRLHAGDVIEVVVPPPPPRGTQPEQMDLDILFEDRYLIVLNKSPDVIVHPARSELSGTLINGLAWHLRHTSAHGGELSTVGGEFARPGVVHRLDRNTSGCIVFAKQDEAHWKLGHQFEHRRVDKRYIAVVQGRVEPGVQVIELPIGPHPSREKGYREKYVVRHDEQGKNAVTICRVRERYRDPARTSGAREYSLVELELRTGRTHQIRVHLSHLGWPIVGDDMYAGRPFVDEAGATLIARQALHAAVLGFTHPIEERAMTFTAPVRGDMRELIANLRRFPSVERVDPPGATVDAALLAN